MFVVVFFKKPSIYETRVVKKYFNQHEDPAETADISTYVQKVSKRASVPSVLVSFFFCGFVLFFSARFSRSSAKMLSFGGRSTDRKMVEVPGTTGDHSKGPY